MNYLSKVEAHLYRGSYLTKVEAKLGLLQSVKRIALKVAKYTAPVVISLLSSMVAEAKPFTEQDAKKFDAKIQHVLDEIRKESPEEDISFKTTVKRNGGVWKINFVYSRGGSKAGVQVIQTENESLKDVSMGVTKDKEGEVDPLIEDLSTQLFHIVKDQVMDLEKDLKK